LFESKRQHEEEAAQGEEEAKGESRRRRRCKTLRSAQEDQNRYDQ